MSRRLAIVLALAMVVFLVPQSATTLPSSTNCVECVYDAENPGWTRCMGDREDWSSCQGGRRCYSDGSGTVCEPYCYGTRCYWI
jgi:hypothetical protein